VPAVGIPDGDAYWRRHYGIGGRWAASPRGRRGCMFMLAAALVLMIALAVVGVVIAAT
jgi:hypothetical protein